MIHEDRSWHARRRHCHHVDFISSGARHFLPATSVGYGGGTGKNSTVTIAPWSSLFSSTTQWNGLFDITAIAFDRSSTAPYRALAISTSRMLMRALYSRRMRSKQHWLPEVRVGCNLYAYLSRYRQAEAGMVQFDFFQQLRRSCVRAGQRWPEYYREWCVPAILDEQCLRI